MKATRKLYRIVLLMLFILAAVGLASAQDRISVPSTATGGFGESNACHTALVPALTLSGPQTVVVSAAGRIKFGSPSYEVPPAGITIGSNKSLGALIGVFVEQSRAADPAFQPVNDALSGWGVPASDLFLIGNGPYKFEAPGPGTLFLGINAGDVCGTSGSFSVSVMLPVKIAGLAGGSLTVHKAGGVVPIAILSSSTFDARKINPATLSFAAGKLQLFGTADPSSCHAADANGDGLPDMVCAFRADTSLAEAGTGLAVVQGRTLDGMPIRGETAINIVP
jgi:hypothetical protein